MSLYPELKNGPERRSPSMSLGRGNNMMGKSGNKALARRDGSGSQTIGILKLAHFCVLAAAVMLGGVSSLADAKATGPQYSEISEKASQSLLLDVTRAAESPRIVTVGDRGHILFSDDNGQSWKQAKVPTIQMLTAVYFPSSDVGYAVGHDALVLKSTDGGETWVKMYEDKPLEAPLLDIWFENDKRGIALGAYGTILETIDSGKNWVDIRDKIDNEDEFHYNAIAGDTEGNVYIAGEAGIVFHSGNFGQTWTRLESPYLGSLFGITAKKGEVLIHGLRGNVFSSTDKGQSWNSVKTGSGETLFGSVTLKGGKSILVGNSGSFVAGSEDQWQAVNRSDRVSLSALAAGADGNVIAVGQGGIHRMTPAGKVLD